MRVFLIMRKANVGRFFRIVMIITVLSIYWKYAMFLIMLVNDIIDNIA